MPIAAAEQNRAVLAIADAGDDHLALASADPTAAGSNLIAAAGRAEIDLGREAGDPAGEAKNLAAVDFAPTALVENATHFAIMTAAAGGNVRAWGRLLNDQGHARHGLATNGRRHSAGAGRRRRCAYPGRHLSPSRRRRETIDGDAGSRAHRPRRRGMVRGGADRPRPDRGWGHRLSAFHPQDRQQFPGPPFGRRHRRPGERRARVHRGIRDGRQRLYLRGRGLDPRAERPRQRRQ